MIEDNDELNELYQSLVFEHSKKPRNFGTIECSCHTKGKNPSCGDEINLYVKSDTNQSVIDDIKFTGEGCALCIASTSLMTQAIKGKDLKKATKITEDFIKFITEDATLEEEYEPLHIFSGVKNFPLRVKCVLLGWRALEKSINKIKDESSHGN
jgi:nitrogen fixation NifU-like protein